MKPVSRYNHAMKLKNFLPLLVLLLFIFLGVRTVTYAQTLRFVQLSDTHITNIRGDTSYKMLSNSYDLLSDAVKQINSEKGLDFAIVTGDAVDLPTEDSLVDFIRMMNKLNVPWYTAMGNHDVSILGKLSKHRYVTLMNSYNKNFDSEKGYYSFVPKKGFKVIVMDSVIDNKITSNGYISEEQLLWLDKELKSSQTSTVLIFMHHPLLEPYSSSSHRIKNANELYALLDKYKQPIGLFTGHYHAAKITKEGNIVHVSSPSLVTYPNAFRLISVTNYRDKVIFDFYFKETGLKEVQKKARLKTLSASSYEGADKDRSTSVTIEK